ncbi:MAG: DUF5668 domain-containing protein [Bacteriovoracaceae bacterium]|nr:DUF5668 domain-containing protein [Bacteroidota bacterium]
MDKKEFNRIPFFGIILVLIGVGLLLRQLHIIRIDGTSMVLFGVVAYGAAMVFRSFMSNIRQALFFGSLCFFSGIVLLLGKYDLIEHSSSVYVPGFLLSVGLSFTMLYIYNFKDYHLIVPSAIFIALGIAFMMTEIGYLYPSDVKDAVQQYWPVAIIAFGILMLFRRKEKKI